MHHARAYKQPMNMRSVILAHIEVPTSLVSAPANPAAPPTASASTASASVLATERKSKHRLAADVDPIYAEMRDLNFAAVGKRLNRVAHRLDEEYKVRTFRCSGQRTDLTMYACRRGTRRRLPPSCAISSANWEGLRRRNRHFDCVRPSTHSTCCRKLTLICRHRPVRNASALHPVRDLQEISRNPTKCVGAVNNVQLLTPNFCRFTDLLDSYDVPGQITAIEDLLAQGADMQLVIRLLCLVSITAGGIKSKTLESIKRELLQVSVCGAVSIRRMPLTRDTQTYGYNFLPLLLSLATPPLGILLPNPLPASAPVELAGSKYPYAGLRKTLRLVVDGDESLEELENDISYVYSGYAPISVRLVQCVAQKGGVLSNPAAGKDKSGVDAEDGAGAGRVVKMQAHPIVGFKGFEDVIGTIPGRTVDVAQTGVGGETGSVSRE
jgi:hypothetical protein